MISGPLRKLTHFPLVARRATALCATLDTVRTILIRSIFALAGLSVLYLFAARPLTLLVDRLATVHVRSLSADSILHDWNSLRFRELRLDILDGYQPSPIHLYKGQRNRIILAAGEQTFALGTLGSPDSPNAILRDPGDEVALTMERSVMSWPTPLAMNFMTGYSPSRKRNQYYKLVWKKRSGARLDLAWRYEQWFYSRDGWSNSMTQEGHTGLVHSQLRPDPAEKFVVDYVGRTKQWKRSEYRIESQGPSADGKFDVFAIVYRRDEADGGQSLDVYVDRASHQVRS